jgi:hypothetical protein
MCNKFTSTKPQHNLEHNTFTASRLIYLYEVGNKNKNLPINTAVVTCVKHLTSLEFYHSVCIKNDVVFLLASPLSNTNLRPPLKVIFIGQNINVSFRRRSGFWPNRVLTNAYMHSSVGATVPYVSLKQRRGDKRIENRSRSRLNFFKLFRMKVDC